jgi:hypothetical protein
MKKQQGKNIKQKQSANPSQPQKVTISEADQFLAICAA